MSVPLKNSVAPPETPTMQKLDRMIAETGGLIQNVPNSSDSLGSGPIQTAVANDPQSFPNVVLPSGVVPSNGNNGNTQINQAPVTLQPNAPGYQNV